MKYVPSLQKISVETLATLAATILAALIISRIPALKKIVRDSNT